MSALSPEARARLRDWLARYQSCADSEHMRIPGDDSPWGPTFGDLRALLADSDALSASEAADRAVVVAMEAAKAALETVTRERDEARADAAELAGRLTVALGRLERATAPEPREDGGSDE